MDSCYQIGTFPNVNLIILIPFNPFVVSVKVFHFVTTSIA